MTENESGVENNVAVSVLFKPESQRTLSDVKLYVDDATSKARQEYEEAAVNPKYKDKEYMAESYYDNWSELDDVQKGLEGKAPISKSIDYFRKQIVSSRSLKEEVVKDAPAVSLFGDESQKSEVSGAVLFIDTKIKFYEQSIDLITKDLELKKTYTSPDEVK